MVVLPKYNVAEYDEKKRAWNSVHDVGAAAAAGGGGGGAAAGAGTGTGGGSGEDDEGAQEQAQERQKKGKTGRGEGGNSQRRNRNREAFVEKFGDIFSSYGVWHQYGGKQQSRANMMMMQCSAVQCRQKTAYSVVQRANASI